MECRENADSQVDQIGNGEYQHITGPAQHTVRHRLKPNEQEKVSDEGQISRTRRICLRAHVPAQEG